MTKEEIETLARNCKENASKAPEVSEIKIR